MRTITVFPDQLPYYMKRKDYEIWDVREQQDYIKCHVRGAKNVPFSLYEASDFSIETAMKKEMNYIFYCERGHMSLEFARIACNKGYHVKSVIGGIRQIKQLGIDSILSSILIYGTR